MGHRRGERASADERGTVSDSGVGTRPYSYAAVCVALSVLSVGAQMVGDEGMVVGWQDGALRGFDAHNGDMTWELNCAHRGEVRRLASIRTFD